MSVLRPYQVRCVDSIFKEFETVSSTLIVLPTGSGKSVVFSEVIRRMFPKRSIVIAHRGELIYQAAKHVRNCGLEVQIEKAELKCRNEMFGAAPVVVASVQSLISGGEVKRLSKFNPDHFGLLVIDECHRSVADSYEVILKHFKQNPSLKVLGATATTDRLDRMPMGKVFESVAATYEIVEAINDGWLTPIEQQFVRVGSLDLSHIKTTAGDLNGAELSAVLEDEQNVLQMCGASLEIIGGKKSICFTRSVEQAEKCAEVFNRHRSGMAVCISGKTPDEERDILIADFKSRQPGDTNKPQILTNCNIAVEGFDVPDIECVIMCRPTKSRIVYSQAVGRGLRPLVGILDDLHSSYERRESIAASAKRCCLVLDFVGNSGKHKLVSSADILGGKFNDETKALALKKAEKAKGPVNMQKLLEESEEVIRQRIEAKRRAEEARKAKLVAKVHYSTKIVSPFDLFDIAPQRREAKGNDRPLSDKQRSMLQKIGVDPESVDYRQAQEIIIKQMDRWKKGLATVKQCAVLKKFGYQTEGMTFPEAKAKLDALAKNNWRRPHLQPA